MKSKWLTSIFDVLNKLLPRLSIFRAKIYAFPPLPSSKIFLELRLNTLGQKQYLVGEVGENCLIRV